MAIGLLATITVLEGKNEEFEQTFLDLTETVSYTHLTLPTTMWV